MPPPEQIHATIYRALEELEGMLPPAQHVRRDLDAPLSEPAGPLNSLGLVNLVVALEGQVEQAFGVTVNLTDESGSGGGDNPFASVRTLARHLEMKLRSADTR